VKRYYIQIGVVVSEGYDEAEDYPEILALAMKYKAEEQAKHGELGKMWFDIEEVGFDDEV
jgi:hypothetical protein